MLKTMAQAGECYIFYRGSAPTLVQARQHLVSRGLNATATGDCLQVQWHEGPTLQVRIVTEKQAPPSAVRASRGSEYAETITGCGGWFEVAFESLEAVLDEINTLIE